MDWDKVRQHAEASATMYIGSQEHGHKLAILCLLELVWKAKVFRRPRFVTIDLSPMQYIVCAHTGPLLRPIQKNFSFGTDETLSESWEHEGRTYIQIIQQEDEIRGLTFSQGRSRRGWRYCFSGPTGPRLSTPSYPSVLAKRLVWGLRTDAGLWCEAYQDGRPVDRPFVFTEPSAVGLFAAANLDPRWFTGLPFTKEDARRFAELSHRPYRANAKYPPQPRWTPGDIYAKWHPDDELVSDSLLTDNSIKKILKIIT